MWKIMKELKTEDLFPPPTPASGGHSGKLRLDFFLFFQNLVFCDLQMLTLTKFHALGYIPRWRGAQGMRAGGGGINTR